MNETRPSRSLWLVLSIAAGLSLAALAAFPLTLLGSEPASEPILFSEGMTRPVHLYTPPPDFHCAQLQGTMTIEIVIDKKGRVTDTRALKSLPLGLDRKVVEAVRSWRFKPALLNGKPVKVFYKLVIEFNLKR